MQYTLLGSMSTGDIADSYCHVSCDLGNFNPGTPLVYTYGLLEMNEYEYDQANSFCIDCWWRNKCSHWHSCLCTSPVRPSHNPIGGGSAQVDCAVDSYVHVWLFPRLFSMASAVILRLKLQQNTQGELGIRLHLYLLIHTRRHVDSHVIKYGRHV